MSHESRERLRAAQAELLKALVQGAPPPVDFEAEDVVAAAESLADKRRHEAMHAWPGLTGALGEGLAARFEAFAQRHPLPAFGGPLAGDHPAVLEPAEHAADHARRDAERAP